MKNKKRKFRFKVIKIVKDLVNDTEGKLSELENPPVDRIYLNPMDFRTEYQKKWGYYEYLTVPRGSFKVGSILELKVK